MQLNDGCKIKFGKLKFSKTDQIQLLKPGNIYYMRWDVINQKF